MRRPIRRCRRVAAFLALVWLSVSCGTAFVQGANLVANPLFTRDMPVPGWIGDHREAWVREHPVYRARCENAEVIKEVRYLNRVIAYDEYLLSLTTASDASASPADKLANVARQSQSSIRRDIVVVDALVAQLRLLPSCDEVMAPRPAPVSMIPAQPMRDAGAAASDAPVRPHDAPAPAVRNAAAPAALAPAVQSAVSPVAPAPAVRSAASPVAPAPQPAPASPAAPAASDRILIRFDNRIAALTPSGIRSFDAAVIAWRGGKPVRLAIEGCEAGADFSNGSPCARRLLTLKRMLAENGIRDSKRLLGDTP